MFFECFHFLIEQINYVCAYNLHRLLSYKLSFFFSKNTSQKIIYSIYFFLNFCAFDHTFCNILFTHTIMIFLTTSQLILCLQFICFNCFSILCIQLCKQNFILICYWVSLIYGETCSNSRFYKSFVFISDYLREIQLLFLSNVECFRFLPDILLGFFYQMLELYIGFLFRYGLCFQICLPSGVIMKILLELTLSRFSFQFLIQLCQKIAIFSRGLQSNFFLDSHNWGLLSNYSFSYLFWLRYRLGNRLSVNLVMNGRILRLGNNNMFFLIKCLKFIDFHLRIYNPMTKINSFG